MPGYEVPEPILNSPFEEPAWQWNAEEGKEPEQRAGRLSSSLDPLRGIGGARGLPLLPGEGGTGERLVAGHLEA